MDDLLCGIIGNPILHSRSPQLFRKAFSDIGISGSYLRLAVDSAKEGLELANFLGLAGINITAPFKEEMFRLVPTVNSFGALNCVRFDPTGPVGFCTDPHGVAGSVGAVKGRRTLVIGAGGAARAAVYALIENGARVTIVNRTAERAEALAKEFGCSWIATTSPQIGDFQVLVNTVPELVVDRRIFHKEQLCLDAIYQYETDFSRIAKEQGASVVSGTEWLLHTGVAAVEFILNRRVSADSLRSSLLTKQEYPKRIVLIGMMGSGKSTIGPVLAAELGWEFIELDSEITHRSGKSIPEIFSEHGEERFRELEREELQRALSRERVVLSTGGGAPIHNPELFSEAGLVVWLYAPIEELEVRLASGVERPLLAGQSLENRLSSLWGERRIPYARVSDLLVPTYPRSKEEVVRRVCDEVRKAGFS